MLNSKIKSQISKYRIVAQIGQGGMSIVYRAVDMRLGRDVALKVLHPFLSKDAEGKKRLEREAQIAAKLQHPNILQIYDYFGESDDPTNQDFFIVSELILGNTLKEFTNLYPFHEIPELGALIIRDLAYALQHAHSLGVIHRDIKPENIMIREDGTLKLMDFGIAQIKQLESLTVSGTLLGSPAHMAPESIEGKLCDHRADIFSLSTVMYWLLTGRMPFDEKSPHAILKAIVDGRFVPPQQISSKISDPLNQIILRGMEVAPENRFKTAEAMANAITEALKQFHITKSSTELKQILANPTTEIFNFKEQVIGTYFKQIAEMQRKKQTVKVMSLLGRILAAEPKNNKALRLLSTYEPKTKFKIKPLLAALLILILVTSSSTIYFLIAKRKVTKKILPNIAIISSEKLIAEADTPKIINTEKPTVDDPNKIPAAIRTTQVNITINPFADFYINNQLMQASASNLAIQLKPGTYLFTFKHEFAATKEKKIHISANTKKIDFAVSLTETKPALLTVECNTDADIAINGIYKGTANSTTNRPILISMPDRTHALKAEIIISKSGYEPVFLETNFVAGRKKNLQIKLVPKKD